MWSQIHRYILRQTAIALLVITVVLTAAIWLVYSLRFVDYIINRGLSLDSFLYLIALTLPRFIAVSLPLALFCAVAFAFYRLLADSELVVLRASGLSDIRLAAAPLLLSAVAAVLIAWLNLALAPAAARAFKDLQFAIRNDLAALLVQPGVFRSIRPGVTLYVRDRIEDQHYSGLLIHDERHPDRRVTLMAERGAILVSESGPRVILANGNRQEVDRATGRMSLLYFDRHTIELGQFGANLAERMRDTSERSLSELLTIAAEEVGAPHLGRFRAEAHHRLAATLHAPALAMIALVAMLYGQFNRRGYAHRVLAAAAVAIAVEAGALGAKALAARYMAAVPLLYIVPLAPIGAGLFVLLRPAGFLGRPAFAPQTAPTG